MRELKKLSSEEKRMIIKENGGDKEHLVQILLRLQEESGEGFIDEDTACLVAEVLGIGRAQITEILRFYTMLEEQPSGRYKLEVCNSSPCYYSSSTTLAELLQEELGIGVGETTEDGMFTLAYTPCIGACAIGPVVKCGERIWSRPDKAEVKAIIDELRAL